MIGREEEIRQYKQRVSFFYGIVVGALCLLGLRLFFLQVLGGEELRRYSEANRLKKQRLFPTRGIIYDRHGQILVENRASFDAVLYKQYYKFDDENNKRLSEALHLPLEDLEKRLKKAKRTPAFHGVLLKADLSREEIASISMAASGFPGVDIEATVRRRYPYGDLSAQVLGYVGQVDGDDIKKSRGKLESGDHIGKRGIERYYDSYLRGRNGIGYVEVDASGHRRKTEKGRKLLGYVAQTDPVPGENLHLTFDIDLSIAAREAMHDYSGSVVALDPRSGEVLAMVNTPSYNPDLISGREIDPAVWRELSHNKLRPLRNRAIQDFYPPGSTFKPFLSLAALATGTVSQNKKITCSGKTRFGRRWFHCWKRHGLVDFYRAIRESCDIYFYDIGHELGIDNIAKYARQFNLGAKTGINLAGEQRGLIPDTEWKQKVYKDKWHPGETLSVAIGQGYVSATPLQLAVAFGAISNSGFVYRPYVVRKIQKRDEQVIREFQPELTRKVDVSNAVFEPVKEGLFQVVNAPWGTAGAARSEYTIISGKTGTAQVRSFKDIMKKKCNEMDKLDRHHGLFVGYAPRENPEIVVAAIAEHSCSSSKAVPIVRAVIDKYFEKKLERENIDRDQFVEENKQQLISYLKDTKKIYPRGWAPKVAKKTATQTRVPSANVDEDSHGHESEEETD